MKQHVCFCDCVIVKSNCNILVCRCNVHGVSSKKIKHMLDTYEHNITGQSLFAMLPPLNLGKVQTRTTPSNTSVNSAQNQSKMPAVDISNIFHFSSSLSCAQTSASSADSVVSSSRSTFLASVPHTVASSGYVLSADNGVRNCSLLDASASNFVSETVGSHTSDIPATAHETLTLPGCVFKNASESSICCESVDTGRRGAAGAMENDCSADALLPVSRALLSNRQDLVLLVDSSAHSSSSDRAAVTSPFSAETVIGIDNEKFTGNSAAASSNICAEIMQTSELLSASEMSQLISSRQLDDETVDVVTEDVQSASDVTCSARNTDTASCSSAQLELESLSCAVSDDVHLHCGRPHTVDANMQDTLSRHAADTQSSDLTVNKADTLLIPSVPELANCSMVADGEGAKSVDRRKHLLTVIYATFCDMKSTCTNVKILNGDLPTAEPSDIEHLKHITLDKTMECESSHETSKNIDEFPLHLDAEEKDAENEASSTDHSIDKGGTTELLCENNKALASVEENLLHDVAGSGDIQSLAQSDKFVGSEARVKNLETQRVAELMYWEPTDTSKRLSCAHVEAKVRCGVVDTVASIIPIADSLAEQSVPGMEPKPRRTSLRSCQKAQMSSLMERIVAGKEWLSECEPWKNPVTQCEHGSVDVASSHSDIDQCRTEQCSVLHECQSNSTQTEPADFVTLAKATSGEEVLNMANYIAVVETSPRVISSHVTDNHMSTSLNVPVHLMLHKSCSTADESENVENSSQLDLLTSCFPTIGSHHLQELLTNCGNDIIIVADLLLEFGYEYNEPQEDIADIAEHSSSSCSNSTRDSPDCTVAAKNNSPSIKETKMSKKNTSTLCRLYRDSLIPKGIVAQSTKIQPARELQVRGNLPTLGLYLCVLFC